MTYVGPDARVSGDAQVYSNAQIGDGAVIESSRDWITALAGSGPYWWTAYRTADGWALNAGCAHFPDLFKGPGPRHDADADFDDDQLVLIRAERSATLAYLRKMARVRDAAR